MINNTPELQQIREALELAQDAEYWPSTLEKTCPQCCPNGDDPKWKAFGNNKKSECAYVDCRHPLTVLTKETKKEKVKSALITLNKLLEK
jgi:hypothetical protein